MGYRGKVEEQNRARDLRAQGWTIKEIESELGVSRSSVSIWVRDVEVDPEVWAERVQTRINHGWVKRREGFVRKRVAQAQTDRVEAERLLGEVSDRQLFIAGIALYAGEGGKTPGAVTFPNSDPRMIRFFLAWFRRYFCVDEARLRVALYLHEGLDLDAANAFWTDATGIPLRQFTKAYRAVPDPTIRRAKHAMGCPRISYSCAQTHRTIMSLVDALLSSTVFQSGVAQLVEQGTVNAKV